jgi:KaiC/GvpD/RAD55 family RecA-like ATPase
MKKSLNLQRIANELGMGEEIEIPDGFLTKCPCCSGGTALSLRVRETIWGLIRYSCDNSCRSKEIHRRLMHSGLLPARYPPKVGTEYSPVYEAQKHPDENIISLFGIPSSDLLSMEFEELDMFIAPFLRVQSVTMLYSHPGVGKSMVVHSIACGLTRKNPKGIRIGPWTIKKGCEVLLVDGELPLTDLSYRLALLGKPMGEECKKGMLTISSSLDVQARTGSPINLTKEKYRNDITEHFSNTPECKVLILDNLTSLTDGMNENVKMEWAPINRWLLNLRGMGVTTILVHHANKGGKDRGHSSIRDNLDNIVVLKRKSKTVDKVHVTARFEKGRHLKPGEGADVELELVKTDSGGLKLVTPTYEK